MVRVGFALSVLLFLALGSGVLLACLFEPHWCDWCWHGGKSRAAWLSQLAADNADERELAAKALGEIGEPAVAGLVRLLHDDDPVVRAAAGRALAAVGPVSVTALSDAHAEPRNHGIRGRFRVAVVALGPAAAPAVIELLRSARPGDCDLALATLPEMRAPAELVVRALAPLMERGDRSLEIVYLLGRIGPAGVAPLLLYVRSPVPDHRLAGIATLGALGADASSAVPALLDLLEEPPDEATAAAAAAAIEAVARVSG